MQPSTTLTAEQIAKLPPEQVARAVAAFGRESVTGGDLAAHIAREALIDLWQQHRQLPNRAQTVADLVAIEIASLRGAS